MADKYFNDLNYSLANEDTRLELDLCKRLKPKSILSICGSGGRFLPLLAAGPQAITALDLAPQQLYLAELRQQTIIRLDFQDFRLFWGFPPFKPQENRERRRMIFQTLDLSPAARSYFDELFSRIDFGGLIYEGKWEKTMASVPKVLRRVIGSTYDRMFSFETQAEQDRYFEEKLQSDLWKSVPRLVLLLFGNAAFFNALLYRGHFVKKNLDVSYYDFYRKAFRNLFKNGLARENFFLQICFFGEIRFPEGNPIEALEMVFDGMKKQLQKGSKIDLVREDVLSYARKTEKTFDFVSLSDVPSYFEGEAERSYLQDLKRCLNPGAVVVVRCYLRVPEGTQTAGYKEVTSSYAEQIAKEKVGVYNIHIYEYSGS